MDIGEATLLLRRLKDGDTDASKALFPLVQQELHRLAGKYMRAQREDHTLQPTALVNEAWLKLVDVDHTDVNDRSHFFRLAASAMRSVLVDHAKGRRREKRGGGRLRVTLDSNQDAAATAAPSEAMPDLLDLDETLTRLTAMDEQLGRIVELRFFGGLTSKQIGEVLGCSSRTVDRGWRVAQAWLTTNLEPRE
jgi:RNA polymerase sigma factor (TIGR02999 family)